MESRRRPRSNTSSALPPSLRGVGTKGANPSQLEIRVVPWTGAAEPQGAPAVHPGIERLESQLQAMAEALTASTQAESERAARLHQLCAQLADRKREILALIGRVERTRYRRMIGRLHRLLEQHVPRGAVMAIISRGDEQLLAVPGRQGWHFPQAEGGVYAGHHPADSDAAITHLEEVRARGARYLVIPRTAFWWLDHYHSLDAYLRRAATCIVHDDQTGALFALPSRRVSR